MINKINQLSANNTKTYAKATPKQSTATFGTNTSTSSNIYSTNPSPKKFLTSIQSNMLSFKGMETAEIKIDNKHGYTAEEIRFLFAIAGEEKLKPLFHKFGQAFMKKFPDFEGKYYIESLKEILQHPEKEEIADLLFTKKLNGAEDFSEFLKFTDNNNFNLVNKILSSISNETHINFIEIRIITDEIQDEPAKEAVLDKLFAYTNNESSGITSIIEDIDLQNQAQTEMLDFMLNTDKDISLLVINQILEDTTSQNIDAIKQIVTEAPGKGQDAARYIIHKIKEL